VKGIKKLGLLTLVMLALAAVAGAASASASGLTADEYPATLSSKVKTQLSFGYEAKTFATCGESNLSGLTKGPVNTVPMSASGFNCGEGGFGGSGVFKANGCELTFHTGAETAPKEFGSSAFNGTVDIGPVGCGPMTVGVNATCTVSIYPKTGLPAYFENIGTGKEATVVTTFNSGSILKFTTSGTGCPTAGGEKGYMYGGWYVSAKKEASATGLHVLAKAPVGAFIAGKESAEEKEQPRFESEGYPTALTGQPIFVNPVFNFTKSSIKCNNGATFTAELSGVTKALPVSASYGDCTYGEVTNNTVIVMNTCKFVYNVQNSNPPYYAAKMDIACSKEGDMIETLTYTSSKHTTVVCKMTMGPQTGLVGVQLETLGSGIERAIGVATAVKGITYTTRSALCSAGGIGVVSTNGEYIANTLLYGTL